MTVRREFARDAFLLKRPSAGSGRPEPVEGRISFKCFEFHVSGFKLFQSDWGNLEVEPET